MQMFVKQAPINSGFGPSTTAQEVVEGLNLSGKTAIVTGGYSGLGLQSTRALVSAGAHVIVTARRLDAARIALAALDQIEGGGIEIYELDLSNLNSVRRFAEAFVSSGRQADIVINNAGIMACPEIRVGQSWEAQFATNHLGHYALTNLLWPALVEGARVVTVSSAAHHYSPIRWNDMQFERGYDKWLAYGQSKTANALFSIHLDAVGRSRHIRAFTLHPGSIATPLQRHIPREEMIALGWMDEAGNPANPAALKTPQQGAATQLWAALSPQLEEMGGLYCEDCDIANIASNDSNTLVGVREHAIDPEQAQRLWTLSASLTGINAFTK
jgi:NAD(P)-dependent dehydrogenase (short-subunit alcohol dehydrogenase family)